MTDITLSTLAEQGEGYYLEFKRTVNAELKKELVAFANASGGDIYIGIDDDGSVANLPVTNALLSKVQTHANDCDPPIDIEMHKITNYVLRIVVKEGDNKPYRCSSGFYIRNGANAQKMNTDTIVRFIEKVGRLRFDEQIRNDIEFAQFFSKEKWDAFCQLAGIASDYPPEAILTSLGALKSADEKPVFTNAGLLFFTDEPWVFLPQATVACVLYKGTEKVTILDRKEFNHDIIDNINSAMQFIQRHINLSAKIEGLQRQDVWEIPEVALREAVVNAVAHRDYLEKGARVVVEIFDNRIVISNPGGLPPGMTQQDFGKYSLARNPTIASLLLRANYIEKLGTGVYRINQALEQAELEHAKFEFSNFFTVTFERATSGSEKSSEIGSEIGSEKESLKTVDRIVVLIKANPTISASALAKQLAISARAVEKHLANLKQQGRINRVGSAKGGHWEVVEKE